MSYAVKEMFLTLQGEGAQSGRRAVFCRFAGCNLWTGLEKDRSSAVCNFCDTDFVGMDGTDGGRYDAQALAAKASALWGAQREHRYIVLTGGEPMLQVDDDLVAALHSEGFEIAIESNGTIAVHPDIDWVCISPKAQSQILQRCGNELKLVWLQPEADWHDMAQWEYTHLLVQPMDAFDPAINAANRDAAMAFVAANPRWRLSLQNHKALGIA